jgi:parallel beta-helix repeat protein
MSWNKIFSRLAASVLLALAFGAWGADFCVDNAADFQNALTSAETNGQADRIKLVQGTYNGHFVYDSAEAQAPEILGGYSAGCTSRTLDPANTELNGGGTGTVLAVTASLGADFTLEGVTLSGGDAASIGGGLHVVSQSDVTLNENIVSANSAGADGGGAYLETTSRVTLTGNRFTGNTNDGLYVDAPFVTLTDNQVDTNTSKGAEIQAGNGIVELTDNAFTANTEEGVNLYSDTAVLQGNHFENNDGDEAYLRGELVATNNHFDRNGQDGIEVVGGSGFTLTDNSFSFNLETGAYFNVYNHGDVTLIGNDFEGNLARGAYVYVGIKDATLTDNRFIDNQVASSNHGGGAYVYGGTSTLTNNRFAGNTAGGHGGGVYVYGGTTTLVNNGFNGNQSADHGGGAYLDRGTATLTNNSFANNKALHGAGLGISLYYETQGADLYNNPFWNNAATVAAFFVCI